MIELSRSEIRAIVYSLLILPVIPIGIGWFRVVRWRAADAPSRALALAALVLVTCSQALVLTGLAAPGVLGPDYSSWRFTMIIVNLIAMVAATVLAVIVRRQAGWALLTSGSWLTCSWLYMAAVSSAV